MNYTINEIPDTATEANNTDYAIMWQNKTKKISISNLFKKLVKKSEVTNTISAINENPVTSKAVSSLLTISASTTTITDAPPLQNGITLRIFFTSEITGSDNTTVLQITYNGTTYNVKVPKDGALQNYVAFEVSSGVFKYLQAYTTLELLFDGTQFVIIGNPVVLSGSNYLYYADGSHNTNTVASGNMQSVTANAVASVVNTKATFVDFSVEGAQTLKLPTGDISDSKNLLVVGWQIAAGQVIDVLSYYQDTQFTVAHLGTTQTLSYTVTEAGYIDITNTIGDTWKVFRGRLLIM